MQTRWPTRYGFVGQLTKLGCTKLQPVGIPVKLRNFEFCVTALGTVRNFWLISSYFRRTLNIMASRQTKKSSTTEIKTAETKRPQNLNQ